MLRVLLAPTTVLAHLNPVGIVALALIRLVVAALAVLTGEGYSDSYVSAGHFLVSSGHACAVRGYLRLQDPERQGLRSVAPQRYWWRLAGTRPKSPARRNLV